MINFATFADELRFALDKAEAELTKFKERLEDSPAYAFQWADGAVEAAAIRSVFGHALKGVEAENGLNDEDRAKHLLEYYRRQTMTAATTVPASSSRLANLLADYERKATARVFERLSNDGALSL